jgi:hypothetical protein
MRRCYEHGEGNSRGGMRTLNEYIIGTGVGLRVYMEKGKRNMGCDGQYDGDWLM